MKQPLFQAWQNIDRPVIGMLHAPPLPGSPGYRPDESMAQHVIADAQTLVDGGVDGLMLENLGDAPFYPGRVPAQTVASLTALAMQIKAKLPGVGEADGIPLGINVLRNDGLSALAIAKAVGAQFIRVNVLCGVRATDQGLVQGIAHDLMRERAALGCSASIKVIADVRVKHSAAVGPERPLADEVKDIAGRGMADVLVVTGAASGRGASIDEAKQVREAAGDVPVWIGSGVTPETVTAWCDDADGFIVGTGVQQDGKTGAPVDPERVKSLLAGLQR